MEIIRANWRNAVELLVLNLILVPFMVLAPVGLVVLPLFLVAKNPSDDFSGLAQLFVWTVALSCAFWTLVYSHWSSAMAWQCMGPLKTWRRDHGGLLHSHEGDRVDVVRALRIVLLPDRVSLRPLLGVRRTALQAVVRDFSVRLLRPAVCDMGLVETTCIGARYSAWPPSSA